MNTKFTPGPWVVFDQSGVIAVETEINDKEVVHWSGFDASSFQDDNLANAKLIAAAPDLLDALQTMLKSEWMVTHDWGGDRDSVLIKAEQAIEKATS